MRCMYARKFAVLFAVLVASASAQQRVNPSNQIQWPSNCANSGLMVYNWLTNSCIPVSSSVNPIVYEGVWNPLATYVTNNAVYYAGSQYISLIDGNQDQTPGSSPLSWALLLSGGGSVQSVFGRTGVVTAQSGDYNFSQIAGTILSTQLPAATPSAMGAIKPDGVTCNTASGILSCSGTGVPSVFGRTGPVTAQSGDYSFSQIGGTASPSQLPTATNSTPGIIRPDGSTCTVTSGVFTCTSSGGVTSAFGRTGAVTAQSGDYTFAQIGGTVAPSQLPPATSSAQGVIRPDGTTCTVTAGVLSCTGGGMSGQTTGNLPLATSATASTTSSAFFQNSSTAGLYEQGYWHQASTVHCLNAGVTFTQYGCDNFDYYDDGSAAGTTPRNMTGLNITGQFWGPAGCSGVECRTSTLFGNSNNGAFVTPGIKFTQVSNMNHFGIGDSQGYQLSEACHTGTAYANDQGCQLIYAWTGEQGHWAGVVASGGTNTSPKVTSNNAHSWCVSQQNQTCTVSPGWVMLDRSVTIGSGKITAAASTGAPVSWLGYITTDQTTLPVPAAWGTALGVNLTSTTTWDAPVSQTFTIGAGGGSGSGSFAAGDHACVIGNNFFEQRIITSVSGSAGAQTITIPLSQPEGSIFIAKGDCGYIVQDADAAQGIEVSLPAISLDGSHLLTAIPAFGGMYAWYGQTTGTAWSTTNGDANSGFHVYAGARVDRVDTTRPGYIPFADDAIVLTLEPNSAFNVGDNICSPDFPEQKVDGMELTATQTMPTSQLTGLRLHIGGHGANGAAALMRLYNDEPANSYVPFGGALSEPAMITQEGAGAFGSLYTGNYTPLGSAFAFSNHQPGQTSYYIWNDPSWGKIWLEAGTGMHVDQDLHAGSYYSGGKLWGYGVYAGPGQGSINAGVEYGFGNGTTPSVWLAQEYSLGNTNNHLAVTTHGGSRVAGGGDYYAAPDGTLDAGTINTGTLNATTAVNVTGSGLIFGVNATDSGSGFFAPAYYFEPNATTGSHVGLFFGRAWSNYDSAHLTFYDAGGSGSTSNKIALGFYGANDLLTIDGNGNGAFAGGLTAHGDVDFSGATQVYVPAPGGNNDSSAASTHWVQTWVMPSVAPVYNTSGTLQTNAHLVTGSITLDGSGAGTVTLSSNAVYTSSSSYACTASNTGSIDSGTKVAYVSGSSFTINGQVSGSYRYNCVGN